MKRYYFTTCYNQNRKPNVYGKIYRLKNKDLELVTTFEYNTGCCRGSVHEAFNTLVECGEIPIKWLKSSKSKWSGEGYFWGEVTNHYSIKEL